MARGQREETNTAVRKKVQVLSMRKIVKVIEFADLYKSLCYFYRCLIVYFIKIIVYIFL